ncbi:MAG TPA: flagellar M-ring protein FliF C-terminal domain-containing protein [Phycisphaerae bacterium]|nr:flagellar M-ring protein FliF C-terminal domain-containing protein [Phycisphaerae bacterium]HRY69768.1 flagellar M-ring protein FliF C-terminal domain-containing protein [Phycisphaerae bacterium]HSA29244.1 flagellar M-ring protein FliF C-terminal domain-containing protein [Phycisphaerae bacterium]
MEFLRKLIAQTGAHLKGLTISQRLAVGSCAVLIVVALGYLVHWASTPTMVALLDQPMTSQEVAQIEQKLTAMRAAHKTVGGTIMVPTADRVRLYAQLAQSQSLPRDTSIGFDVLIKEGSVWATSGEKDRQWSVALQNQLAQVLRQFDGIEDARVFINNDKKRGIGQPSVVPTASVFVRPKGGLEFGRDRIAAIANMVSGAVSGLDPTQVKIADMVSGRSYVLPKPEEVADTAGLEARQRTEAYFANKIRELYASIPGLLVAVHARLDDQTTSMVEHKFGKPVLKRDKSDTMTQTRGSTSEEPGVNPNTSVAIAGGGAPLESTEKNTAETEYDAQVDSTVTKTEKRPNGIKDLFASVNVPRSYLAAIFKKQSNGKDPTDAELATFAAPELAKMKGQVRRVLGLTTKESADEQIEVTWIHDDATIQMGQPVEVGQSEGVLSLVKANGGKVGLGALAVLSLLMMLMMVRRVSEGPVLPGEEPPTPQVIRIKSGKKKGAVEEIDLTVAEEPIGEAALSDSLLVGKEIDESTLHRQKVVDQVVEMINDDPDGSVGILKRWIDAEQK